MRKGFRKLVGAFICIVLLFTFIQPVVNAEESIILIYYNGHPLEFTDAQPVLKDGRTLVPFRKLFETLGFKVDWVDKGNIKQAIGKKEGLTIELTINSTTAKVNGKNVTMDVPAQVIGQNTMVPLRFVSENSGYTVSYAKKGEISEILIKNQISFGSVGSVEPFVVKGRVVDELGNPLVGETVVASNQFDYTSFLSAVTDKDGYYRIELPQVALTWKMMSTIDVKVDGKTYRVDLTPDINEPFGTSKGAIRNFTYDLSRGNVNVQLDSDLTANYDSSRKYAVENVEITLIPIAPSQLGGSGGTILSETVKKYVYGMGIENVPAAKYLALAHYIVDGEYVPMLIRPRYTGEYAEAIEIDFLPDFNNYFIVILEVLPTH